MKANDRPDDYLPSAKVCERYGIVAVTLRRWVKNDDSGFPQPLVMGNRWYFKKDELETFERRKASSGMHQRKARS